MKASIFLATTLGIVIAGTAPQAQAAPARIAEFGTAPEITLIAQAKISRTTTGKAQTFAISFQPLLRRNLSVSRER